MGRDLNYSSTIGFGPSFLAPFRSNTALKTVTIGTLKLLKLEVGCFIAVTPYPKFTAKEQYLQLLLPIVFPA
jgi:hypothetical protein